MDLVYIAGAPASGKSTLMAELTRGCDKVDRMLPLPHVLLLNPGSGAVLGAELGRKRDKFPGTDTLSMGIAPVAKRFVQTPGTYSLVLAEGDRLGFPGFLRAAMDGGYTVTLVHTVCPEAELDARCERRGSKQNQTWRAGRRTKAANLAAWAHGAGCLTIDLDTDKFCVDLLAASLCFKVPALQVLPGVIW
jgi:hypothetical protein